MGGKDKNSKIVRTFTRVRGKAGGKTIPPGTATLSCGSEKWGYRHIKARHLKEWEADARLAGENWRDTADYAMEVILRDPDKVTYAASNDTFCYSRIIYLVNKRTKKMVGHRVPNILVARKSHNIITAIPKNKQCS